MKTTVCGFFLISFLGITSWAMADKPYLVADVNRQADESDREEHLTVLRNYILFSKETLAYGKELWRVDTASATPAPTLVKDIRPGPESGFSDIYSNPDYPAFRVAGTVMFFCANDGERGNELWKTDGTAAGTVLVKDIAPGAASAFNDFMTAQFTAIGSIVYFAANDGVNGLELWRSDGTAAGTYMVRDIVPGAGGSAPWHLTAAGTKLFFSVDIGGTTGRELWKSDGTSAGTVLVKDVNPVSGYSGITYESEFEAVGSILFFVPWGDSSTWDPELWRSDGTAAGTYRVKNINVTSFAGPRELFAAGNRLYFFANDGTTGWELWKSDGTEAGTLLVKDINPGPGHSGLYDTQWLLLRGNTVVFFANSVDYGNLQLWKTDGTAAGTLLIKDLNCFGANYLGRTIVAVKNLQIAEPEEIEPVEMARAAKTASVTPIPLQTIYFDASDGTRGFELWQSDATPQGTRLVRDINVGPEDSAPSEMVVAGGRAYFVAYDEGPGCQLFRVSPALPVTQISSLPVRNNPAYVLDITESIVDLNGEAYFFGQIDDGRIALFKTDGTPEGTVVLKKDVLPADVLFQPIMKMSAFKNPQGQGLVIFAALDPLTGWEPWITDGTEAGTHLLLDIDPGPYGSIDEEPHFEILNGRAFFVAYTPACGQELWKTDGTAAGTMLVKDIWPGPVEGWISDLTAAGNLLYFRAEDGVHGSELWRSDGKEEGTFCIDIVPGGSSTPSSLTAWHGYLIFTADTPEFGGEPWISKGTAESTVPIKDIRPGPDTSFSQLYAPMQNFVLFTANDGPHGWELWRTDGTASGTYLVKDIYPGPNYSWPFTWAHPDGEVALITADNGTAGHELWTSDGTPGGTYLLKDIWPGAGGSWPNYFAWRDPKTAVFSAADPVAGDELWQANLSDGDVFRVYDIYPGKQSGTVIPITTLVDGYSAYFYADDGLHGAEIWRYKIP